VGSGPSRLRLEKRLVQNCSLLRHGGFVDDPTTVVLRFDGFAVSSSISIAVSSFRLDNRASR
jgi:hypothetical protein